MSSNSINLTPKPEEDWSLLNPETSDNSGDWMQSIPFFGKLFKSLEERPTTVADLKTVSFETKEELEEEQRRLTKEISSLPRNPSPQTQQSRKGLQTQLDAVEDKLFNLGIQGIFNRAKQQLLQQTS